MSRLNPVQVESAQGATKELLGQLQAKLGAVPNIFKHMAVSPATLQAYLGFSGALAQGKLSAQLREKIALAVAEMNHCGYCLAAHSLLGKKAGLSSEQILESRKLSSGDSKEMLALQFVKKVVLQKAEVSDQDVNTLKQGGYSDEEIIEIVAAVALNIFTNYFNHVVDPQIDFPKVS